MWQKMKDYQEDKGHRIENQRHAGIVLKGTKILLVHRIKNGYEYYVFPGGHRREGEKGEDAVIREINEETQIIASDPKLMFEFKDYKNNKFDFYYVCKWVSGEEPKLKGEEKIRNCKENYYRPMWIELNKVTELNILPHFAKEWILENMVTKRV